MKIIIDSREPKELKTILKSRLHNIEETNLEIGDIQIWKDDKIILIFERKSLNDLICSIKDGRYNEQSFRLNELELNNNCIYYLIEGNIMNFCNKSNETLIKMLFSSMLSLSYKKGFSILHTNNLEETAEFLIRFYEKINNDKDIVSHQVNKEYLEILKSSKKSKITKDNINEIMLSQIPNISSNLAKIIMGKFITVENLIYKLRENPDVLNDIQIVTKNSNRKISKNVIKSLKDYLL